jgi:hypothetical protein
LQIYIQEFEVKLASANQLNKNIKNHVKSITVVGDTEHRGGHGLQQQQLLLPCCKLLVFYFIISILDDGQKAGNLYMLLLLHVCKYVKLIWCFFDLSCCYEPPGPKTDPDLQFSRNTNLSSHGIDF